MKQISKRCYQKDGQIMRCREDVRKQLNLSYLSLTNKTHSVGEYDFPVLYCDTDTIPNYLALYNQPCDYHRTLATGVCFYNYDIIIDGKDGLYNAIYYQDKRLLDFYKDRFQGIQYFISPDYSQFGDVHKVECIYRLWKARIVSLWLINEMHAVLIPNATYISEETFPLFFSGLEKCSVIAFSTKGHIRQSEERRLLRAAVKYSVDHLPLKTIVVYSVCGKDETALKLFHYALDQGIRVVIPENSLRERNRRRCIHP